MTCTSCPSGTSGRELGCEEAIKTILGLRSESHKYTFNHSYAGIANHSFSKCIDKHSHPHISYSGWQKRQCWRSLGASGSQSALTRCQYFPRRSLSAPPRASQGEVASIQGGSQLPRRRFKSWLRRKRRWRGAICLSTTVIFCNRQVKHKCQ